MDPVGAKFHVLDSYGIRDRSSCLIFVKSLFRLHTWIRCLRSYLSFSHFITPRSYGVTNSKIKAQIVKYKLCSFALNTDVDYCGVEEAFIETEDYVS